MAFPLSKSQVRYAIAGFAVLGAAFMGYLTHLHSSGSASAICDISENLSCSFVNSSAFSELFGIPIAVLGILYFLTIVVMMLVPLWPDPFRDAMLFTVFSLLFGLYLSGVELLVLDSFCLFCELSKLIMAIILVLAVQGCRADGERVRWAWVAGAAALAVAFSGAAYVLRGAYGI